MRINKHEQVPAIEEELSGYQIFTRNSDKTGDGTNLRKLINRDSNYGDLDKLFSNDFEIDSKNDFPLMYMVTHKIHQDRYEIAKRLNLPEKKREIVNYVLAYDDSPEDKIISGYVYRQLKKNKISKKFLDDFRMYKKANVFSTQGIKRVERNIPQEIRAKIWPEYKNYKELEVKSNLSFERILASGEKEKFITISKDAREKVRKVKGDFEKNKYTPNPCPENWKYIELKELHNFSGILNRKI